VFRLIFYSFFTALHFHFSVSSNAGHSNPTCGEWVHQPFHPLTRSMTRAPSPGLNEGGSASTSTCRSISDASFSIQLAALRPTVTHARTPHKVTSSGWKPLTQPVVLSEGRKCAGLTTAKRSRVASSRAVKDSTNHSASRANKNVPSGAYLMLYLLIFISSLLISDP
jgi:hypothetical protein